MATTNKPSASSVFPIAVVVLAVVIAWYGLTVYLNAPGTIERVLDALGPWTWQDLVQATLNMQRPVLPAPHQVAADLWTSLVDWPLDSPRNLLFHVAVTGESTLVGFAMGTVLGLVLSICIVHSRTLDRALLPWVVAIRTRSRDCAYRPSYFGEHGVLGRRTQSGHCHVLVFLPSHCGHGARLALAASD